MYVIIKPFLSQRTKDKIVLVDNLEQLKEYIDESQLLLEHQGTSSYIYNNPPPYLDLYLNLQ